MHYVAEIELVDHAGAVKIILPFRLELLQPIAFTIRGQFSTGLRTPGAAGPGVRLRIAIVFLEYRCDESRSSKAKRRVA